ncbi:NifB/NifX family molybdenum-iron cluster-binding protein [Candidatus Bathyarchaeota archaeon]|nr:NifB/NifX family molybdenum-iron cluster-binding protein [Candidatus Bathyarchaeota archaeon]
MKIAISSSGKDLESFIDPRFGRCSYFIIVDTDTLSYELLPNSTVEALHGAGIQAAQLIVSKGVNAVLTGNIGPNALNAFSAAGIDVYTGASGIIKDVLERFKRGELSSSVKPTVGGHFVQGGRGMGRGRRSWT